MPQLEGGISPKVVTSTAVVRELMETANINIRTIRQPATESAELVPAIGPLNHLQVDRLAKFFVMATLILGGADALMLAVIAKSTDAGLVYFPGWEIY